MATNKFTDRQLAAERQWSLSRRHFLRGLGACVALPALPSLLPRVAHAEAAATVGAPRRMAFITIPNGVNQEHWWPKGTGKEFQLAATMEPLAPLKDQIQVIAGLDHINATAGPDGAGDHARASASLLTGCRAKKTSGADIRLGTSIDQLAAQQIGHLTRFPSLELTCDNVRNSGNCDSGYSCAYQYNVSWRSAITPMPPERNPRLVFERLFGSGSRDERRQNLEHRREQQRSILDFIRDDARSLARKASTQDGRKLDEYLTSIREVEQRIALVEQLGELPNPNYDTPEGVPDPFEAHMRVMYDMIVLAFQTDSTRIATLIVSHDGSNRAYSEIGVDRGHHDLSHHGGDQEKLDMIAKIDKYHMQHFAAFLDKLAKSQDADGHSILHNSMIAYTGGNADGNAHSHTNLPMILAGSGGGGLQTGRFHQLQSMPMSNMFLDMLDHMDIAGIDQFSDCDGRRAAI
ncbi:MAG: DUF1552 domain-containing protein [Planctomycetes bacterium]|nr:DUF1552 domain-containing protein [Planctomycetota bacterium]